MGEKLNLLGQRFGRLLVIEKGQGVQYKNYRVTSWVCQCDCGNIKEIPTASLVHGNTRSCGCIKKELLRNRNKRENTFELVVDYYIGYDGRGHAFKFDIEDYDVVSQYCWSVDPNTGYVTAHPIRDEKQIKLHRLVMGVEKVSHPLVDHINNDPTDCRRCNLRFATQGMNQMNVGKRSNNASGVIGVSWHKASQKWRARIAIKGKELYLGIFDSFEEAVKARREAEELYFGEFSYTRSQEIAEENEKQYEGGYVLC